MAHWDSKQGKIVRWPAEPVADYPGWVWEDCGCSAGLSWGGESPGECTSCDGSGKVAKHMKSGAVAVFPGGPLKGREAPTS